MRTRNGHSPFVSARMNGRGAEIRMVNKLRDLGLIHCGVCSFELSALGHLVADSINQTGSR